VEIGDPRIADEFITIARVVKTQGRHGEVAVELYTSFPERFEERRHLWALTADGARIKLELEDFWPHKGGMVLKFAGIDSINDAEKLKGSEIQITRQERTELPPGEAYVSDLVGCMLVDVARGENEVGTVADVNFDAGEAPLLVVKSGSRELLIPFAEAFVRRLDVAGKRIEMALPEGMLELDAPLSQDEKRQQQKN
jgi:16S rRNA processing protein RimM